MARLKLLLTEGNVEVQVGREVGERRPCRRPAVPNPRFPSCSTGDQVGADRWGRSFVDVEVEVDADPLEEVVVERDEADFDRDLQVLSAAQLLQQVDDLLVHFLRLADDQAQVVANSANRARSADFVPGLRA